MKQFHRKYLLSAAWLISLFTSMMLVSALALSAPGVTAAPSVSSITYKSANFTVTINTAGTGYALAIKASETAPTASQLVANGISKTMAANAATTFTFNSLQAGTAYKIYFVAKGADSSVSALTDVSLTSAVAPLSNIARDSVMSWIAGKVAALRQNFCYRKSYDRGAGTIPTSGCPSGQYNDGGLCYPNCKTSYDGVGPVCWQDCPSGYTDTGAFCQISKPLLVGPGTECAKKVFGKCIWWRTTCPSGYTNAGVACGLNTPSVPSGYDGVTGLTLTKKSYGNGAGSPQACASGKVKDAGLCYDACKDNYTGLATICWQQCPAALTACGTGCASSKIACVGTTVDMITAPIFMAADIATAGGAGTVAGPIQTGLKAMETGGHLYDAGASIAVLIDNINLWNSYTTNNFEKMTTPEVVSTLNAKFAGHPDALAYLKEQYMLVQLAIMYDLTVQQTVMAAFSVASSFDKTGVTGVVSAYLQPQCANDQAFPTIDFRY